MRLSKITQEVSNSRVAAAIFLLGVVAALMGYPDMDTSECASLELAQSCGDGAGYCNEMYDGSRFCDTSIPSATANDGFDDTENYAPFDSGYSSSSSYETNYPEYDSSDSTSSSGDPTLETNCTPKILEEYKGVSKRHIACVKGNVTHCAVPIASPNYQCVTQTCKCIP